jgi:hypothetical protein
MTMVGKRDRQILAEDIKHNQDILQILRHQLRDREILVVKHGMLPPTSLISEVVSIKSDIDKREQELMKLESQLVENGISLEDVQYRLLIAESWDTPSGMPGFTGNLRMEAARLEHGIPLEAAAAIEKGIRLQLAREACQNYKYESRETQFVHALRTLRLDFDYGWEFYRDKFIFTLKDVFYRGIDFIDGFLSKDKRTSIADVLFGRKVSFVKINGNFLLVDESHINDLAAYVKQLLNEGSIGKVDESLYEMIQNQLRIDLEILSENASILYADVVEKIFRFNEERQKTLSDINGGE